MEEKDNTRNIDTIRDQIESLNKLIDPYKIAYVSPVNDCVALEKNAHYMEKNILDKLVSNVSEDGFLSQLPFALKRDDGKYLIMSGNHRLKAAIKAKLDYILILFVENIGKDKQIAYQLSHNSLVGKDDVNMLKDIFMQIESLDMKEFTGINDNNFIDVSKIKCNAINDDDIELIEMRLYFVEPIAQNIDKFFNAIEKEKNTEYSYAAIADFEQFIKTMTEIKIKYNIKSPSTAFLKMIEICKEKLNELNADVKND